MEDSDTCSVVNTILTLTLYHLVSDNLTRILYLLSIDFKESSIVPTVCIYCHYATINKITIYLFAIFYKILSASVTNSLRS